MWFSAVKFGIIIIKIQEAIELSLDSLNRRHESISKILKIPLFYDSPEIRNVVIEIKKTKDIILSIASYFANIDEYKNLEKEEKEDQLI